MCGIVGYVGHREAEGVLVGGLRKLEYRGYDSAGLAILDSGRLDVRRAVGKLDNLQSLLNGHPMAGTTGIGHTRWATHGRPSERNAHPHRAGDIVVIHNGIIENFLQLRGELAAAGCEMTSDTDTEVIGHLIEMERRSGKTLADATRAAIGRLRGSFAIVALSSSEPDRLVAAKNATPVVVGIGDGENIVASDIPALLDYTRDVLFLEDGEMAEVTATSVVVTTFAGAPVNRASRRITWDPVTAQKGGYKHFLLKEIHEQPVAIVDTLRGRLCQDTQTVCLDELEALEKQLDRIDRLTIVACGTAWHAALIGRYAIERLARIHVDVDYGSEYRYRDPVADERTLMIVVSQSGETADTLAAVDAAHERGAPVLAICNVVDSSIARRADHVLYTHAGPEISVASTKAFTTQLSALYLLAVWLGRRKGALSSEDEARYVQALVELPLLMETALKEEEKIARIARQISPATDMLYLGRGVNYPVALEGALKLKEISYIHAEGYPSGEMKHGPIALIDETMPVLVLAPKDDVYEKTISNLMEVQSRGGRIFAVTDQADDELMRISEWVIAVPHTESLMMPVLLTVPLQLLAYHVAVERGTDVDQPRNLAKSVTVE
ncbi:MAG TPA: glutamine--fructose-6-phosphate transaminase (isomerizing) [Candidatus Limnocylindrales bacterium]|nr:glutamine--fructose-6-phosphate transaminase (isomerizing) [Candidatus Limnocylindrales bacterium]